MEETSKNFAKELLKTIDSIIKNKIYGSIEIYFEAGQVTQITQRIINKIQKRPSQHSITNGKAYPKSNFPS